MDPRETSQPWADSESHSNFHMVDVTGKAPTKRRAEATGTIRMSPAAFALVRDKKLPKGDALVLAEIAGISAAKQTPNLLPLCHPLPLEEVRVQCDLDEPIAAVRVSCQVSTTAKTGVEMEALVGASVALLCLYDLIKMVEPALVLEQVRLNYKEGGKHGVWKHPEARPESVPAHSEQTQSLPRKLNDVKCAVVTMSDRVSEGRSEDRSGPLAVDWLKQNGALVSGCNVVPDDKERIQSAIRELVQQGNRLIITTGGTGLGPRDITIDSLQEIATKEMRGIGEFLRQNGSLRKPSAWLSNSSSFVLDKTLIIALPGNSNAVAEGLAALTDLIPHALHIVNGGNHGEAVR